MKLTMCILSTIAAILLSTFILKILWIIRMGSLAHWSYLIGSALYPANASGCVTFSAAIFGFILLGTIMPNFLCPRVKLAATALSIPPQVHMLFLLHRHVSRTLNNDTVRKSVQAYTALTFISTVWTIFTLLWNYRHMHPQQKAKLNNATQSCIEYDKTQLKMN